MENHLDEDYSPENSTNDRRENVLCPREKEEEEGSKPRRVGSKSTHVISKKENRDFYAEAIKAINDGELEKLTLEHCKHYLRKHTLKVSGSKAEVLKRIKEHLQLKNLSGLFKDVINNGAGDLKNLKVDQCKAYLRKYGLKVSGSKAVLLERIQKHLKHVACRKDTAEPVLQAVDSTMDSQTEVTNNAQKNVISMERKTNATQNPSMERVEQAKFIKLINDSDGDELDKIKVETCRAYLRNNGLRLTGSKSVLLDRIREHLRISDGSGQEKYPLSTFIVECTGDACVGDTVFFEQTVYEEYDIRMRGSLLPPLGKRAVAGRIVKESYGAQKQQHTFTVEVLWSSGVKALPPLHPLIIKGRNLYRMKTLRQRWENEEDRRRVLKEKHERGAAARHARRARIERKNSICSQVKSDTLQSGLGIKQGGIQKSMSENEMKPVRASVPHVKSDMLGIRQSGIQKSTTIRSPLACISNGQNISLKPSAVQSFNSQMPALRVPAFQSFSSYVPSFQSFNAQMLGMEDCGLKQGSSNSRITITIKASVAGLLIGKQGRNVREIRSVSGAKVQISDNNDPNLRTVEISGTPDQMKVANTMITQRIETNAYVYVVSSILET